MDNDSEVWTVLAAILFVTAAALISGCTTPPPEPDIPRPANLRVFRHTCDANGVNSVTIGATEAGVSTLRWDNQAICGTPS